MVSRCFDNHFLTISFLLLLLLVLILTLVMVLCANSGPDPCPTPYLLSIGHLTGHFGVWTPTCITTCNGWGVRPQHGRGSRVYLAWCDFLLGRMESSEGLILRALDRLTSGHLLGCDLSISKKPKPKPKPKPKAKPKPKPNQNLNLNVVHGTNM